jgi:inner membrane protein
LLGDRAIAQNRTAASDSLWLSPPSLALAAFGLVAADVGSRLAGNSVVPGGPLDEAAHLLTTLLILWALDPRASERFVVAALAASVAIDIDHVPGELGAGWLTAGTPRPYTHSLLTVALVVAAALAWRRRRVLMLGVAFGLALHLWRDMSETGSGVSLFWPFSYRSVRLSHAAYLAVMALAVTAGACRLRAAQR